MNHYLQADNLCFGFFFFCHWLYGQKLLSKKEMMKMKRRDFIKGMAGLAVVPFMPSIPVNPLSVETNADGYIAFMNAMIEEIAKAQGIPVEIIKMDFTGGKYSLSKQMIMYERQVVNRLRNKIENVEFI
jgi:hypothetical protein